MCSKQCGVDGSVSVQKRHSVGCGANSSSQSPQASVLAGHSTLINHGNDCLHARIVVVVEFIRCGRLGTRWIRVLQTGRLLGIISNTHSHIRATRLPVCS